MPSAEDENPQDSFKKYLTKSKGLTRPGPNITLGWFSLRAGSGCTSTDLVGLVSLCPVGKLFVYLGFVVGHTMPRIDRQKLPSFYQ